jgi:hypothetical protein
VLSAGSHTTTSGTIPANAAPWDQILTPGGVTSFSYKITEPGAYAYVCSFHTGMAGSFTATGVSSVATLSLQTSVAFPNPFTSSLVIKHQSIDQIVIFNMLGEKVKAITVPASEVKSVLELTDLNSGIYFYSLKKNGVIIETKKITKG